MSMIGVVLLAATLCQAANLPQDKRTILTSGDKVHTIHYQLGQSTVISFGLKPETVICGNKNYFNIEKIKDGIAIQPLSNFSTNLTVLSQGRRYLFYLTPAAGGRPDGFVEVKWIPEREARPVIQLAAHAKESVREINQTSRIADIELTLIREVNTSAGKRVILDLELKNLGKDKFSASELELVALNKTHTFEHQVSVWEQDEVGKNKSTHGRLILSGTDIGPNIVVIGVHGKSTKIVIKGVPR